MNKFGAVKTNGFASKLESAVYEILKLRQSMGVISDLKCQDSVTLKEKCEHCGASASRWKVDFSYLDNETGKKVFVEAKGVEGPKYKRDLKLWRKEVPYELHIFKGNWRRPRCVEVVNEGGICEKR